MVNFKAYILGAGISGLATALELAKKGCEVILIEKSQILGGLAGCIEFAGRAVDLGPHIYHTPDKDIEDYFKKEFPNLFHERHHWAANFKQGNYYPYPISRESIDAMGSTLSSTIQNELDTRRGKKVIAETYYDYMGEVAGPTLRELFFTKYPEKLWGLSTKQIDANWAPKRIQVREKKGPFYDGQWSAVGVDGSGSIVNSLKAKLIELGVQINQAEEVVSIEADDLHINRIITTKKSYVVGQGDVIINTLSYTKISSILGFKSGLSYRGVILVYLHVSTTNIFPSGIDFAYYDSEDIIFHRVSDQNSFVKTPKKDSTVICCEIAYTDGDDKDGEGEAKIIARVIDDLLSVGLVASREQILDSKLLKLPEVYPKFIVGYRDELSRTRAQIEKYNNLYTIGSLAEFAYADLQILFGKAIDLAKTLTDRTLYLNRLAKNQFYPKHIDRIALQDGNGIGEGYPPFIVAEIGLNHNGNLDIAKSLIDQAIASGVSAVKIQSYIADKRVAVSGKTSRYVEKVLGTEETDYEMLKRFELSYVEQQELFEYARNRGVLIFSAAFDMESVEMLELLDNPIYKIASFDLSNYPLLRKVAQTGKPIIISTGASDIADISHAIQVILNVNRNAQYCLLQCTSVYPCPAESINLKVMDTLRAAFSCPIGFSDHFPGMELSIAAVARGATIIEKHFTLDSRSEGPDHALSLMPDQMRSLVGAINNVIKGIGSGVKRPLGIEYPTMLRFKKSLYFSRNVSSGSVIREEDIELKGPAFGIHARDYDLVVGAVLAKCAEAGEPIQWEHVVG